MTRSPSSTPTTAATSPAAASSETASPLVRVEFPAPAPASAAPASDLPGVALVTLQRPEALNALSFALLDELATALEALDGDPACRAIVITGSGDRAFAAGADIRELEPQTSATLTEGGAFGAWDRIAAIGLPLIAAVRGFALVRSRRKRASVSGSTSSIPGDGFRRATAPIQIRRRQPAGAEHGSNRRSATIPSAAPELVPLQRGRLGDQGPHGERLPGNGVAHMHDRDPLGWREPLRRRLAADRDHDQRRVQLHHRLLVDRSLPGRRRSRRSGRSDGLGGADRRPAGGVAVSQPPTRTPSRVRVERSWTRWAMVRARFMGTVRAQPNGLCRPGTGELARRPPDVV